jgi:DNA-binding beta-propeller fold protein YncE
VAAQPGVVTLVGAAGPGYLDGPAATAKLAGVEAIAVDPAGNLWVGETANHRIRKVTPDGTVTTVAGTGVAGFADGPGLEAQFGRIAGFAMDPSGTLYIADMANKRIRKLDTLDDAHAVTTLAQDLDNPACLTLDDLGVSLYVTEFSGLDVQQVAIANGTTKPLAKGFTEPWGIAVLPGQVYVTDSGSDVVKQIDLDGTVTTFATGFSRPRGLAADGTGRLLVADQQHHQIKRVGAEGATEVFAGTGSAGDADGAKEAASFRSPTAIAVGPDGAVYVVDRIGDRIRVIR